MKPVFLILLITNMAAVNLASAVTLSSTTAYSRDMETESVSADGDLGGAADEDPPFYWNLSYEYERSITPQDSAPNIVDSTYDYSGSLGWLDDSNWGLNAAMEYSNTPDEQLIARGGRLALSYRLDYGPLTRGYSTYWNFKLLGAATNYLESFNGEEPRSKNSKKTKPVSGTEELRQSQLGLDVAWKPLAHWKFDVEFDRYSYNRDVGSFQDALNSPLSLQMGMSGFTNTVGGLPRVSYSMAVYWDFHENWRAALSEQYALLAADDSISSTTKLTVSDQLTKTWKLMLGAEYLNSETTKDTLALLGVTCDL